VPTVCPEVRRDLRDFFVGTSTALELLVGARAGRTSRRSAMKKTMVLFTFAAFGLMACSSEATTISSTGGAGEQDQAEALYTQISANAKPTMPANFVTMPKNVTTIDEAADEYAANISHEEGDDFQFAEHPLAEGMNVGLRGHEPTHFMPDRCVGDSGWAQVCCYHTGSGSRFCCTTFGGNDGNASGCGPNF
jgi:hypothetical protein